MTMKEFQLNKTSYLSPGKRLSDPINDSVRYSIILEKGFPCHRESKLCETQTLDPVQTLNPFLNINELYRLLKFREKEQAL